MDRIVRLAVVAICTATLACTVLVWSDLDALVDRPAPGFAIFSSAVVSFALFETDPALRVGDRPRPFERVVATTARRSARAARCASTSGTAPRERWSPTRSSAPTAAVAWRESPSTG